MRKFLGVFLAFLSVMMVAGVAMAVDQVTNESVPGQYIELKIPAPSIQNSLLTVPTETVLAVYLPPSYATSTKHYPVIYFLHGAEESARTWSKPVSKVMDKMYKAGFGSEFIVAFATGNNVLGSTFYTNSPVSGNWEDHITKDVVQYMDSHYRTIAQPGGRAIVGFSMGGYGALALGMKHPELYSSTYAMSPGVFEKDGMQSFQLFSSQDTINAFVTNLDKASSQSDGTVEQAKSPKWRSKLDSFTLAYGMAFAPSPTGGIPFMRYPYSRRDGILAKDETIWKQWYDGFGGWDWKVDTYENNLTSARLFAFDVGTSDYYAWIVKGCKYLDKLLTSKGITHYYATYSGNHGDKLLERMEKAVLPELSKVMDPAK